MANTSYAEKVPAGVDLEDGSSVSLAGQTKVDLPVKPSWPAQGWVNGFWPVNSSLVSHQSRHYDPAGSEN